MNERIKALLLNARNMFVNGVTESDNKIYIHGSEENLEKFAELIVREFASIVEEEIKLVEEFKSTAIKADVIKCHQSKIWHFHKLIDKSKKHFVVEE